MPEKRKVVVAMSGGVDSSVAAALLVEAGYDVTGMMLRLWSEPGSEASNRCCTPDSMAYARRVAGQLGIPFYVIDAKTIFREQVVQSFIDGYYRGVTPNPCLVCNKQVRWGILLEQILNIGADYLATGHYARLQENEVGLAELRQGIDLQKDQSYVLSVLDQAQLRKTLLPLGGYSKPDVREKARAFGLTVAERPDSQDLCFLAGQDYREFLSRQTPLAFKPGKIIDPTGTTLGAHKGLAFFTIGQRKGLGIASRKPLYVLEKRIDENELVVGTEDKLGQTKLIAAQVNWISGSAPSSEFRARVKIRYRSAMINAIVQPVANEQVKIEFDEAVRDITPGQRAVFYEGDRVVGGGDILTGYD